jgi:protein RecA
MAKTKTKKKKDDAPNEDDVLNDLVDGHDGVLLQDVGATKYFIDTGNLALNYINSGKFIGGGIPGGKITEIYGPPAASKSLVGMSVLHGVQQLGGFAIFLDCEHAANRDFAVRAGHVDPKRLVVYEPETIEETFLKIHNVIRKIRDKMGPEKPICFVYDSVTSSPPSRELREVDLPEGYTKEQWKSTVGAKEQPGERAKLFSKEFRKIVPILDRENATLFCVNQVRMKIGLLFGNPETTPGGEALKFYASCRIRVQPQKIMTNTTLEIPVGVNIKAQNKKCSTSTVVLILSGDCWAS